MKMSATCLLVSRNVGEGDGVIFDLAADVDKVTLDVAVRLKNTAKPEAPSVQLLDVYIHEWVKKLKKDVEDVEELNGTVHRSVV